MLIGISPLISPELLNVLYRMGHGDTLVLADAHFPCDSMNSRVIRADGLKIDALLDAILPLFALDSYIDNPVRMMAPVPGDKLDPEAGIRYWSVIARHWPETPDIERVERFEFYDQAKNAFAVVSTGETAKYGNILITKGVTPVIGV